MTVGELITRLMEFPIDCPVKIELASSVLEPDFFGSIEDDIADVWMFEADQIVYIDNVPV